jgi:hypothetical protein
MTSTRRRGKKAAQQIISTDYDFNAADNLAPVVTLRLDQNLRE